MDRSRLNRPTSRRTECRECEARKQHDRDIVRRRKDLHHSDEGHSILASGSIPKCEGSRCVGPEK